MNENCLTVFLALCYSWRTGYWVICSEDVHVIHFFSGKKLLRFYFIGRRGVTFNVGFLFGAKVTNTTTDCGCYIGF